MLFVNFSHHRSITQLSRSIVQSTMIITIWLDTRYSCTISSSQKRNFFSILRFCNETIGMEFFAKDLPRNPYFVSRPTSPFSTSLLRVPAISLKIHRLERMKKGFVARWSERGHERTATSRAALWNLCIGKQAERITPRSMKLSSLSA